MRYLAWAVGIVSIVAFFSVMADAAEVAARVAPKQANRIPQSNPEPEETPAPPVLNLPKELEETSVEVGFSQEGEPEPHLLAIAKDGAVKLFELPEKSPALDKKKASAASEPPSEAKPSELPVPVYVKRMQQLLERERFFSAAQPRKKGRCRDEYVLRVKQGSKFRERRGCAVQSNDPFAGIAQNFFRDAFLSWSKSTKK